MRLDDERVPFMVVSSFIFGIPCMFLGIYPTMWIIKELVLFMAWIGLMPVIKGSLVLSLLWALFIVGVVIYPIYSTILNIITNFWDME